MTRDSVKLADSEASRQSMVISFSRRAMAFSRVAISSGEGASAETDLRRSQRFRQISESWRRSARNRPGKNSGEVSIND